METAERVWQVALQFEMDAQAGKMPRYIHKSSPQFQKLRKISDEQADVLWWLGIPVYLDSDGIELFIIIYNSPIEHRRSWDRRASGTFYTLVEAEDSESEA